MLFFVHLHFATYSIMACPSSVPAVSQEVHLGTAKQTIQTQDDTKKKETIQEQELANGTARKKPFKSKCPCPINLSTGKRFSLNIDGTAIDPPKAFVERTIIGKGERLWIWLWKSNVLWNVCTMQKHIIWFVGEDFFPLINVCSLWFVPRHDVHGLEFVQQICVLHVVSHYV